MWYFFEFRLLSALYFVKLTKLFVRFKSEDTELILFLLIFAFIFFILEANSHFRYFSGNCSIISGFHWTLENKSRKMIHSFGLVCFLFFEEINLQIYKQMKQTSVFKINILFLCCDSEETSSCLVSSVYWVITNLLWRGIQGQLGTMGRFRAEESTGTDANNNNNNNH